MRPFFTNNCFVILATACASYGMTFHVGPKGSDKWPGSSARPFATLRGARDAIRKRKARRGLEEPVDVVVAKGTYFLAEPFELIPQDSGTAACPIRYMAERGGAVIVSGGRCITGWRKVKPGLWAADVPEAKAGRWIFRQLFVNGQRRILARHPNTGFFRIQGPAPPFVDPKTGKELDSSKRAFRFRPGDIKPWPNLPEINAVVFRNWESAMLPLKSIDANLHTVTFTGPMKWPFKRRARYYIENAPDALDAPGEWRLDRREGVLYYRPLTGEGMRTAEVIAPVQQCLVRIVGEPRAGLLVSHVRFEGLSFQHAAYRLEAQGHSDWQAAVTTEAAIMADGASALEMRRCEVKHVGAYAVWFRRGCSRIRIEQCEIADCGAGGVRFGEPGRRTGPLATHHNVLTNCFIHDIGHMHYGAVGVWVGQSSYNEITHNEICDTNYTGVSVGWSWGFRPTTCHCNKIELNHIHHIARGALYDLGAIYTLGISTGTTIRNNLIHHVWSWPEGGGAGGIYPDEGSTGILIENNVVYETVSGGLTVHYGRDLIARNNIFAFGRDAQIHFGRKDKGSSLTFVNNIVYCRQSARFRRMCSLKADNNVYFTTGEDPFTFPERRTFAQWQEAGYDKHSVIADPLLVDAERYDFRLRPASPALKLGFKPIDLSKAGLYGDPEWVARPRRIQRPPTRIPPKYEPPPQWIDEGFEFAPVGGLPPLARTYGASGKASIRVTDELAASGRKCLKFVDAAGLRHTWEPHLYFMPHAKEGMLRLTFDLRFEPGAVIWHEWRDNSRPYRVGPSMGINAEGELRIRNGPSMPLPANKWIRFQITWAASEKAGGTYGLVVTVRGDAPRRFKDLPCDPKCKRLDWLGFVSNATDRRVFYLDNVRLHP